MDTIMCHWATQEPGRRQHKESRASLRLAALCLLYAAQAFAQNPKADWRKIGNSSFDLAFASPATGPVSRVWFSQDGARLFARTQSRVFETSDLEHWTEQTVASEPPGKSESSAPVQLPNERVRFYSHPQNPLRIFGMGKHVYRSEDGGRSWTNVTAFGDDSVIGGGQNDVALSPRDPELLIVANNFGVWRSLDGGLSWSGLNQLLPNLNVRRIVSTPRGPDGVRIAVDGVGLLELHPGADREWRPVADPSAISAVISAELTTQRLYSTALGANITAVAAAGDLA
ncbi:MAG: sialidase family protein, partial [Bryobacteraceae bacterium]